MIEAVAPVEIEQTVRVVVIDDHAMFLESVVRLLSDDPAIVVVGSAGTAAAGVSVSAAERPDVIIVDYQLPE
jgi:DNA-binding NarL/FixJ family response regulator